MRILLLIKHLLLPKADPQFSKPLFPPPGKSFATASEVLAIWYFSNSPQL